jgi:hypothetical protein
MNPNTTSSGVGSPISNDVYNVIAALHEKLEGLEAYCKYAQGGSNQIWQQLSQFDQQAVQLLCQQLEQLVQSGKLRFQQPGQTKTTDTGVSLDS